MKTEGPGMSIRDEYDLQAYQIALPVLEQKNHESIIAEQLEAVRNSLTLNAHQNAIISCAIDRLNEMTAKVVELAKPQPDTNRQADDGWIEWRGGECPVSDKTLVEVKYRYGELKEANLAECYEWNHGWHDRPTTYADIIAYRVIENDGSEHE